jgi:hypothetical protein
MTLPKAGAMLILVRWNSFSIADYKEGWREILVVGETHSSQAKEKT